MDCAHHPTCPGCPLADRPYEAQLKAKASRLNRAVRRFHHLPEPAPIVGSAWTEAYRHRLKLPVEIGRDVRIGLYGPGKNRRILHTPDCPVLAEGLRAALPPILAWLRGKKGVHSLDLRVSAANGNLAAVFAARGGELPGGPRAARALMRDVPGLTSVAVSIADKAGKRVMGSRPKVIAGHQVIEDAIGETRYDLLPGSFFQADPRQAAVMHALVRDAVGRASSILDLYSGVGAYGLMLAPGRERVVMVEEVRQAAEAARRRAPKNVEVQACKVEDMKVSGRFDVAILNPARRGSDPASLANIAKLARKLVYVSCGPETLARDLDVLAAHGMRTTKLTPIDLFPQTAEVETVALLERGEAIKNWPIPDGSAQSPIGSFFSGARGRPTKVWMLLVGAVRPGAVPSAKFRPLATVATHTLVELNVRGPLERVLQDLAKRNLRPAGADGKTRAFFAEKAGLQRPFVHVAAAGKAKAPLHGDLALALLALGANRKLVAELENRARPK